MTRFTVGQRVRSRVTAQNLVAGALYRVTDVRTDWTPFGGFVTYVVKAEPGYHPGLGDAEVHVENGHLILEAAREEAT